MTMTIASQYLPDSCDIYSYTTDLKGNTEVAKELLHEGVPCYAYKISNTMLNMMLGQSIIDRFKVIIPRVYNDTVIVVGKHYKLVITKDGVTCKLRVEGLTQYPSQWEVEAAEDN